MDDAVVKRQLAHLEATVAKLRELAGLTADEMRRSKEKSWAVQHGLQIAIQTVLDLGNHLLAAEGTNDVEEYGQIVDRLGDSGILPQDFARRIRPMAGFRNILVHGYIRVDEDRVAQILRDHLGDFEKFSSHILAYLERGNPDDVRRPSPHNS
jgi:uncharacterized protein YutE (UPF0331/DUF86 family)